jgi:hypothetical protein
MSVESNIEDVKRLSTEETVTVFDPRCIRQTSNMSKSSSKYKFDSGLFEPRTLLNDIKLMSPKLETLLKKIEDLDKKDMRKYGKKFKHFIFSDLKSSAHGPKLITSALIASGYHLGYKTKMTDVGKDRIKEIKLKQEEEDYDSDEDEYDSEEEQEEEENGENERTRSTKNGPPVKLWGPVTLLSDSELKKHKGNNFYLLSSVSVYEKPISVKMRKEILSKFNERPSNITGDLARIIVMDSGFKEGIDLFDIKYIHIFEPSVNLADQKQVIGRGTRTCGQKGLDFHPTKGWPLHVFVYDLELPEKYKPIFLNSDTAFDLYMKSIDIDFRLVNFASEIEELSVFGSVDYELNQNIHHFSIDNNDDSDDEGEYIYGGGPKAEKKRIQIKEDRIKTPRYLTKPGFREMRDIVNQRFRDFEWGAVKMENTCEDPAEKKEPIVCMPKEHCMLKPTEDFKGGGGKAINYTPTQNFIRHYFSPQAPVKGMLLYHSVGTGKTCSAIAAASTNFEPQNYTILWVTRTTLKNDIWKNMFSQICNESLRNRASEIPSDPKKQMSMLSKSWRIRPISYKQFSNLVSKQNDYYKRLVKENGEEDPLRKTLLIIDEAHKLYGGDDLSSIERPDMVALHKALMHSYAVSGNDSVRLLLMTATPITESPMEIVQLMNLCRPINQQMPGTFDDFKEEYLNEEGRFTEKGREKYLNEIAGHISYLNREKDARQFAQPIVKRVLVPILKDQSLIHKFDKGLIRSELDKSLLELKLKSEESIKEISSQLNELNPSRFAYLEKKCDDVDLPKKECDKIVKRNIKELIEEIKDYKKSILDKLNEIKKQEKESKIYKQSELENIRRNIERFPKQYEMYKKSAFYNIKSECRKTIKTNKELVEKLNEHPSVQKYTTEIERQEEYISQLKNSLKTEADAYKLKMNELRDLLKTNLTSIERSNIKIAIKDNETVHKLTRKNISKELSTKIRENKEKLAELKKDKQKKYATVKKTLKTMLTQNKKEEKQKEKEALKARNLLIKEGKLMDEIKDENVRTLLDQQQANLERELKDAEKIHKQKMAERPAEKKDKANRTRKLKKDS